MNEPITIPDEARRAAARHPMAEKLTWKQIDGVLETAAPLILAAELDRMATFYWPESDVADYDQSEEDEREGVRSMCTVLRNRAAALRSTVEGGQ